MRDWISHHALELYLVVVLLIIGTAFYAYHQNQDTQRCTTTLANASRTQILNFLEAQQKLQIQAAILQKAGVSTSSPKFDQFRREYLASLQSFENELKQTASCP